MRNEQPDAAVIGIALRHGSGIDLIRQARAERLPVRILVVSMYDDSLFAERALRAGAAGFLNKQQAEDEIVSALDDVVGGKTVVSQKIAGRLMTQAIACRQRDGDSPVDTLSDR